MKKVIRWTFLQDENYPEIKWPISDEAEQEYIYAIVRDIQKKRYRITGFAHQDDQFCTPVFDDGRRYATTFRQWGQIMAIALGIKGEYGYCDWAWCSTEELILPRPGDWDESAESLEQQAMRWEEEQKRKIEELQKDLETLNRLNKCNEG